MAKSVTRCPSHWGSAMMSFVSWRSPTGYRPHTGEGRGDRSEGPVHAAHTSVGASGHIGHPGALPPGTQGAAARVGRPHSWVTCCVTRQTVATGRRSSSPLAAVGGPRWGLVASGVLRW